MPHTSDNAPATPPAPSPGEPLAETLVYGGGAVKALGDGKFEGWLVVFDPPGGVANDASEVRDYFTKAADYGFDEGEDVPLKSRVYFSHTTDPELKGRVLGMAQLSLKDAGVWMQGQLALRDDYEKAIYQMVEQGKLGASSGTASHLVERKQLTTDRGIVHEVTRWPLGLDASLTPTPAEPRTAVMALKDWRQQTGEAACLKSLLESVRADAAKGAGGAAELPIADRDRAWDASAADKRVREWAGAEDKPNSKYAKAFFWHADGGEKFGDFKLGFADVVDGTLTAIPRGVFAVAAALQGSRGGVELPDGDRDAVKAKVAAYYRRMAKQFKDDTIVAPWEGEASTKQREAKTMGKVKLGDDVIGQIASHERALGSVKDAMGGMCSLTDGSEAMGDAVCSLPDHIRVLSGVKAGLQEVYSSTALANEGGGAVKGAIKGVYLGEYVEADATMAGLNSLQWSLHYAICEALYSFDDDDKEPADLWGDIRGMLDEFGDLAFRVIQQVIGDGPGGAMKSAPALKGVADELRGLSLDPKEVKEMLPAGVSLTAHSQTVLAAVKRLATRLQDHTALRTASPDGVKEGRVLSQSNQDRLKSHYDALMSVAQDLKDLLDTHGQGGEDPSLAQDRQETGANGDALKGESLRAFAALQELDNRLLGIELGLDAA